MLRSQVVAALQPWAEISERLRRTEDVGCGSAALCLCNVFCSEFTNHRDTENTEVTQRRRLS